MFRLIQLIGTVLMAFSILFITLKMGPIYIATILFFSGLVAYIYGRKNKV